MHKNLKCVLKQAHGRKALDVGNAVVQDVYLYPTFQEIETGQAPTVMNIDLFFNNGLTFENIFPQYFHLSSASPIADNVENLEVAQKTNLVANWLRESPLEDRKDLMSEVTDMSDCFSEVTIADTLHGVSDVTVCTKMWDRVQEVNVGTETGDSVSEVTVGDEMQDSVTEVALGGGKPNSIGKETIYGQMQGRVTGVTEIPTISPSYSKAPTELNIDALSIANIRNMSYAKFPHQSNFEQNSYPVQPVNFGAAYPMCFVPMYHVYPPAFGMPDAVFNSNLMLTSGTNACNIKATHPPGFHPKIQQQRDENYAIYAEGLAFYEFVKANSDVLNVPKESLINFQFFCEYITLPICKTKLQFLLEQFRACSVRLNSDASVDCNLDNATGNENGKSKEPYMPKVVEVDCKLGEAAVNESDKSKPGTSKVAGKAERTEQDVDQASVRSSGNKQTECTASDNTIARIKIHKKKILVIKLKGKKYVLTQEVLPKLLDKVSSLSDLVKNHPQNYFRYMNPQKRKQLYNHLSKYTCYLSGLNISLSDEIHLTRINYLPSLLKLYCSKSKDDTNYAAMLSDYLK